MDRLGLTPNPHLAIDRLAAVRRAMSALASEEEALARRVLALPDGRHGGMASMVEIVMGADGVRRVVVTDDALLCGRLEDPDGEMAIMPVQME